ncbi:MAG: sodium:glutamate symporter [Oscillibacter sp.]|nr:sodium:glutamate symporter [Oscillibacter sp.]MDY4908155.1 sodium/glutamate symporter [Oscillospiraceae bacterium]
MTEIQLNMYHALALGAAMYALGLVLTKKIPVLSRFCIPAPLVGGLCFAVFNTILYATGTAVITFDDTLQTVFMIMFFTTVGFTVSIPLLFKSGKAVIMLLILSIVMIILQNAVGSGVMALMGKNPLFGLACGSISMIGGPGTAAGIGPDLDAAGAIGGTTVAVAAATFGLIFGSLLGGPIARKLIVKNHLRDKVVEQVTEEDADDAHFTTHANNFVYGFLLMLFCVGVGSIVTAGLTKLFGFNFPIYIGSMLVAVAVRNVIDHFKIMEFPTAEISTMGNMFLAIFLSMALSGLKLWQLIDLALPMIVALAAEVVLMVIFSWLVVFPIMGRDYDAAMITAGFIGFGMGATSNAMANMQAVSRRYGPSPSAYFVIPMVGGLFNDFFNAAIIAFAIGLLA